MLLCRAVRRVRLCVSTVCLLWGLIRQLFVTNHMFLKVMSLLMINLDSVDDQ